MTTSRIKRCDHCNCVYTYHPSTYGFMPEYNDPHHCSECLKVIEAALKNVPVKFKKKWVETSDYTREQIIDAQNVRMSDGSPTMLNALRLPVRRVMPGLFSLDGTSSSQNVCEMMSDPVSKTMIYYSVTWWPKKPDEVEIKKEVFWDVENNVVAKNQEDYRN